MRSVGILVYKFKNKIYKLYIYIFASHWLHEDVCNTIQTNECLVQQIELIILASAILNSKITIAFSGCPKYV